MEFNHDANARQLALGDGEEGKGERDKWMSDWNVSRFLEESKEKEKSDGEVFVRVVIRQGKRELEE